MKIKMFEIPISELVKGYSDDDELGIVGFDGKLDIRPAYQREFVYKDKQRNEVINTIRKDFPLNVMYWVWKGATDSDNFPDDYTGLNGQYEVLDGQQRTISICQYVTKEFSIDYQYFHNLTEDEKQQILDYKVTVYICVGTDREKLKWFKIVNIAGEKLFDQELRNATYSGEWLSDAKKYFSKKDCPAVQLQDKNKLLKGSPIRQDYLQSVLKWIAASTDEDIEDYMAAHQHDTNAAPLWIYFQNVISWVKTLFPNYRKEMAEVEWGLLYNEFHNNAYDPKALEKIVSEKMQDEDITNSAGIYYYVFDGKEKHLNIRKFDKRMIRYAYEKQNGICVRCQKHFEIDEMHADHITPWSKGGKTEKENCQLLCADCNRRKSNV